MATEAFEEHLNVLAALKDNYSKKEDAHRVAEIVQLQHQVQQQCGDREEEVKNAIKALSHKVKAAEGQAAYPEMEYAHTRRVAELAGASAAAKENVHTLTSELQRMQAARKAIKEQCTTLQHHSQQIEDMVAAEEPYKRHQLSLYAHISKITWKFDAHPHVAGAVSNDSVGDVRPFDFDPEITTHFSIVNALWGLMEAGEGNSGSKSGR